MSSAGGTGPPAAAPRGRHRRAAPRSSTPWRSALSSARAGAADADRSARAGRASPATVSVGMPSHGVTCGRCSPRVTVDRDAEARGAGWRPVAPSTSTVVVLVEAVEAVQPRRRAVADRDDAASTARRPSPGGGTSPRRPATTTHVRARAGWIAPSAHEAAARRGGRRRPRRGLRRRRDTVLALDMSSNRGCMPAWVSRRAPCEGNRRAGPCHVGAGPIGPSSGRLGRIERMRETAGHG